MQAKTVLLPASDVPMDRIVAFAKREYGHSAHQTLASFYQWEYSENPNCPKGLGSMIVAVDDEQRVIGAINRLFLTWDVRGEHVRLPAIVDFAVDAAHRQGGVGLRLILKCTSDINHAFINGSNPNSGPVFRSLKYQELEGGLWFRKILAPVRGGLRYGLHKLTQGHPAAPLSLSEWSSSSADTTADPDDALLQKLADLFNAAPEEVKPFWSVATLRWRFFHPFGPRHLLVHRSASDGSLASAMLVSVGPLKGLNVCRLIAHQCNSARELNDLLTTVLAMARRGGIDAFLTFTFNTAEAAVLRSVGCRQQSRTPSAFFFHKRRKDAELFNSVLIQGAASDLGFEAMAR